MLFLFFYYCFDDWLASVTETPWLGEIPWWVTLCVALVLTPLFGKIKVSRS